MGGDRVGKAGLFTTASSRNDVFVCVIVCGVLVCVRVWKRHWDKRDLMSLVLLNTAPSAVRCCTHLDSIDIGARDRSKADIESERSRSNSRIVEEEEEEEEEEEDESNI